MTSATTRPFTLVHALLACTMLLGAVVVIEPAPYDLLLAGTIVVGPLLAWPTARATLLVPLMLGALLLLANLASMVFMADLRHGIAFFGVTAYLVIGWALIVGWLDRFGASLLDPMLRAYAAGASVTSALAVAAYFGAAPGAELMLPDGRLRGLFKDPNVFGAFLVPAVVYAAASLRRSRLWFGAAVVAGIGGILLSYSRGAWINLGLSLLVYAGLRTLAGRVRPTLGGILAAGIAIVALGAVLVAAIEHPTVADMLEIRATTQGYDDDRFANQAAALSLALEHPAGIGPGGTEGHFTISAHSLYIRAFVENGALGLWATLSLVGLTWLRATWAALGTRDPEHQRRLAVVAAVLAGALVESAVIDSIHWRHLWILLAFGWTPRKRRTHPVSAARCTIAPP